MLPGASSQKSKNDNNGAYFVDEKSIVREIWGKADTILFIFAGASAEFALNKAVDWLYFTGKLPSDPLGRLFSTVAYAREIVFSKHAAAMHTIDAISAIHKGVEEQRGSKIPDWAYRDVLFMLISYSISSFELLERSLSDNEKTDVFDVFNQVGLRMGIPDLPKNYWEWLDARQSHLDSNLIRSEFTNHLYKQYQLHLGWFRYHLLRQSQVLVVPKEVNRLLNLGNIQTIKPLIQFYKLARNIGIHKWIRNLILPEKYQVQIKNLDVI